MITVPIDVRCNFCTKTFCCLKCRVNHETTSHQIEINKRIREEYLKSICYICRGEEFPIKINELLSSEVIQHISEQHLPLKCNKCLQVFETINDFQMIGKCCSINPSSEPEQVLDVISEAMGDDVHDKITVDINHNEERMTPLTKINLRWRRKSREFLHKGEDTSHVKHEEPENQLKRQTSTPMQGNFDSLSSMQFSSINCVSSSSETDLSPPVPQKQAPLTVLSPKSNRKKNNSPLSKSRTKMAMQNTPLRQVMTKSIQRAIVAHGHYKHVHLQQRKMTFDSSSSSNEPTMSLMKLNVDTEEQDSNIQPLDLRLSPALRRNDSEDSNGNIIKTEPMQATTSVEYEEIQVILKHGENDNSSITTYKSCFSDSGNLTPKGSSSCILKKTISFEAGGRNDETPGFLLTKSFSRNDETDDIFYTPRTTPFRRVRSLDLGEVKPQKSSSNIWNFVTSVVGSLVPTKSKNSHDTSASTDNKRKWGFSLERPLRAAANYFGKQPEKCDESGHSEEEEIPLQSKRPRISITSPDEDSENKKSSTSPICKRRKIQGRKPIERMRKFY